MTSTCRTTTGSAPSYFHSILRIYIPFRSLRSASERRLVVPSQRGSKSLSRTFSFTIPGRWNVSPPPPSGPLSSGGGLPVALLSSVACELAPLKIAFLCVFIFYFYLSFYTCNFCNDYVRQENTFGHWTALH